MSTNQITRIGQGPNLGPQVGSHLPESSGVKPEPLPFHQPIEANVDGPPNSFPPGFGLLPAAARISFQVSNVEEVELDTSFCQRRSLSAPVSEEILPCWDFKYRASRIGCGS